jgi:hypothetical protein
MIMIVKINGAVMAAAGVTDPPAGAGPLWGVVEKGRDAFTESTAQISNDLAIWILDHLADAFQALGHWLLQVGPDTAVLISMIFCLGAICSIPRCGKYAVWSLLAGVVVDIIRRGAGVA